MKLTDAKSADAVAKTGVPQGVLGRVQSEFKIGVGKLNFGVVGRGTLYWEWMIGREGDCCWSHQRGKERSVEADERWRRRLEERPVQVVLFEDGTKPSRVDASWASPSVKLVIWFGVYRDLHRVVPREGWAGARYEFDHDKLGGVTTGRFRVNIAYRSSEFEKPVLREYKGVPAALGHITDPTIGSGRRCTRVTPESPIRENTGYGLLNWSERFGQVSVATVYSKTHWTKRVLSPTELLSALDAPALISKRASDSQKREWSQELMCRARSERKC